MNKYIHTTRNEKVEALYLDLTDRECLPLFAEWLKDQEWYPEVDKQSGCIVLGVTVKYKNATGADCFCTIANNTMLVKAEDGSFFPFAAYRFEILYQATE